MRFRIFLLVFVAVLSMSLVSATLNVALSNQGTDLKLKSSGALASGNLTVEIFDVPTGGTSIYTETFTNAISGGQWNVMLGANVTYPLPLEYGKQYYLNYIANGEDINFTDYRGTNTERQMFYAPLGDISDEDINDATNLTLGQKITFALGSVIDNLVTNLLKITGDLNVTGNLYTNNVLVNTWLYNQTQAVYDNQGNLNVNNSVSVGGYAPTYFFPLNASVSSGGGFDLLSDVRIGGGFSNGGATVYQNGDIWTNGSLFLTGNISSVTITQTAINGSWYPTLDNTFDNGLSGNRWANGYFINLYAGSGNTLVNTWLYNQTDAANAYTNARIGTADLHTHDANNITNVPSAWTTTYNLTYAATTSAWDGNYSTYSKYWYNMSDGNTEDTTWHYNQTTPAIAYTNSVVSANNASWSTTYNATYASLNSSQWTTTNGDIYYQNLTGRVGIGTSTPSSLAKLHINGTSTTRLKITNDIATSGFDVQIGPSGEAYLLQRENQPLMFYTNATEKMRIDASGNVGIGTTTPNYLLTVANTSSGSEVSLANTLQINSYPTNVNSSLPGFVSIGSQNGTDYLRWDGTTVANDAKFTVYNFQNGSGGPLDNIRSYSTPLYSSNSSRPSVGLRSYMYPLVLNDVTVTGSQQGLNVDTRRNMIASRVDNGTVNTIYGSFLRTGHGSSNETLILRQLMPIVSIVTWPRLLEI